MPSEINFGLIFAAAAPSTRLLRPWIPDDSATPGFCSMGRAIISTPKVALQARPMIGPSRVFREAILGHLCLLFRVGPRRSIRVANPLASAAPFQMTSPVVIERDCSRISRIRPFLYLSGVGPLTPQNLQKFSCVINCIAGFRHVVPSHLTVLHIPIEDEENADLTPYWQLVFQTIEANKKVNGKVLIFCGMGKFVRVAPLRPAHIQSKPQNRPLSGISRSPTFVMAYLVCIERMSLLEAYKYIQARRNIICPNIGFFRQLIELEEKITGKRTVSIIEPIAGVEVADVVWNELYDEVMEDLQKKAVGVPKDEDKSVQNTKFRVVDSRANGVQSCERATRDRVAPPTRNSPSTIDKRRPRRCCLLCLGHAPCMAVSPLLESERHQRALAVGVATTISILSLALVCGFALLPVRGPSLPEDKAAIFDAV
ncbi:hypothetical protein QR680_012990 [Steinernema hermaphroditum]|uniref:Tyrosine-protein phosphatase domain-containing protein n=1 Tax=Steinernema hermaphroditum TaxID=289476 RepID=A0AA39M0U6_9BILA|nr:hypothetical protein QR680_012990 [Steinernema hermaphroditum]